LNEALNDPELKDKINVVFKHFPLSFHDWAKPAAKAALAAGEQGAPLFWAMTDKIFANQKVKL
jgi:protein-disulfide isomerase